MDINTKESNKLLHCSFCGKNQNEVNTNLNVEIVAGKVTKSELEINKTGDSSLGICIQRRVKRWRFPADCSDIASFSFILTVSKK